MDACNTNTMRQVMESTSSPQTVFLFTGEGVHSEDTDISLLKTSSSWPEVLQAIRDIGYSDAESFLVSNLGKHVAPTSPIVTLAIGILNADLWRQWGQVPDVVLGHSVGEIAAAYASGMLTVGEAVQLAHDIGEAVAETTGSMVHTELPRTSLSQFPNSDGLDLAAINYAVKSGESEDADILSVTLCGSAAAVANYMMRDQEATQLKPQHPWHHPSLSGCFRSPPIRQPKCTFVSSLTGTELTSFEADHWSKWLQQPVLFGKALQVAATKPSIVVEMGAHPVMASAVLTSFSDRLQGYVCSMRRKERGNFIRSQRAALPGFREGLEEALRKLQGPSGVLSFQETFAEQGLASQKLVALAQALVPFFPGLAAHDLYRYNSLQALVQHWDVPSTSTTEAVQSLTGAALEVLGCSVRLPAGIDSPGAFWSLIEKDDKESAFAGLPKGAPKAAYLRSFDSKEARAAAEASGCEGAEAMAMDPQHALALQLTQELWRDAGNDATKAALARPDRVGVYIGAWQSVDPNGKTSAYRTIGTSLSALAPRVANAFNLQGPVMTVNTACSSALVAVDHALRDAKAGKIDFAIVGGVNLFGEDTQLFTDLRRAGMLSPSGRCHTFSADSDGYVRAEGGVLFLLHAGSTLPSRARILGSAVTQNSKQKPLSAVDPVAQERVIRAACADAGMKPAQLSAVELHGTGTPLGDPVEVSALSKTLSDKDGRCTMTAAKMHVGHLESAAGGVGLLKAVMMCEQGRVPGFSVPGGLNPQVKAAMEESCLEIPEEDVQLAVDAVIGVSSFGFAGSNAHVVVTGSPEMRRLPKYEACEVASPAMVLTVDSPSIGSETTESPRDGATAISTKAAESRAGSDDMSSKPEMSASNLEIVSKAVCSITGDDAVAFDAHLLEAGVDSLGLAELLGLLEDTFGAGCITIDQIMDEPSVRAIAEHLGGLEGKPSPSSITSPLPAKSEASDAAKIQSAMHARELEYSSPLPKTEDFGSSWIRTTHVGSLPRPADGDFDLSRVLKLQLEAGLDVINDGEWTRDNYIADAVNRLEGLRGGQEVKYKSVCCVKHSMPVAEDMKDVPLYALRFTGGNGLITLNPKREAVSDLACAAHPCYTGATIPSLKPIVDSLTKAGKPLSDGFFSVPSPGTLALFCKDEFFHDHEAYVQALGAALAEEFAQIAETGLQLQVDCPDLAMGRHTRWSNLGDDAFIQVAEQNVAALNRALQDVPFEQIRIHVCWGNYAGPHHKDVSADLMWPVISNVKAKYLLVEGANPRHRNDVSAFEKAVKKGYFKANQVIVPGMIDTTTARVEDPNMIAENLLRYARAAGHPSRVMAGTDCGFATTANSTAITGDIAWMKLKSLAEGARLATTRFMEQSAPVLCKSPLFNPTPFRVAVIIADSDQEYGEDLATALEDLRAHSVEIHSQDQDHFAALRWAVDTPLAIVGVGLSGSLAAKRTFEQLKEDTAVARRPATLITVGAEGGLVLPRAAASEVASAIRDAMLAKTYFDKRCLVLPRCGSPPAAVDVVIVGAGLLGLVTAHRCLTAGFSVAVLEQRPLVGGIWSMYANATSQVNSSEGGYCFKEFIGEAGGANGDNRDHSTAAEILKDFAKLGESMKEHIFTSVKVMKILGKSGEYTVAFQDSGGPVTTAAVTQCRGVVLCINDRVGLPRPLAAPMVGKFHGIVADGTADSLAGVDWKGKRVVIVGMGAFAVENVRTALENGAKEVTVVARRQGTICPKVIDYLNFVKPWDENYKHDTQTNVKQFLRWKQLYSAAGCTVPSCWPKQVKEDGHTISVSDVWFIGHHMKKLSTRTGNVECIETDGVRITSQEFIPCDIVVGCIGFERSNYLVEYLTGRTSVTSTNYLDKDMMYLADAEIDEGAFNSFFGSSVLEYGKFFSNVFVEGLKRGEALGERLWGKDTISVPIAERKWNQYIAAAQKLINGDSAIAAHARTQVDLRTQHFWRTLPPSSFVAVNKKEWEELHQRLNGGVPVPKDMQLKYYFEDAAEWC